MKESTSRRKFIRDTVRGSALLLGTGGLMLTGACGGGRDKEPGKEAPGDEAFGNKGPGNGEAGNGAAGGRENAVSSCDDMSGVSQAELQKRENFGYVKESPIPDQQCQNCNLWLPPAKDQSCGGCTLFKGPVANEAYCTYWAPQV